LFVPAKSTIIAVLSWGKSMMLKQKFAYGEGYVAMRAALTRDLPNVSEITP
jgi:hypothetical protein